MAARPTTPSGSVTLKSPAAGENARGASEEMFPFLPSLPQPWCLLLARRDDASTVTRRPPSPRSWRARGEPTRGTLLAPEAEDEVAARTQRGEAPTLTPRVAAADIDNMVVVRINYVKYEQR